MTTIPSADASASQESAPRLDASDELHPNHLPDLRYARRTLERTRDLLLPKLHRDDSAHSEVAAAINGLNYVIKRTEEAASAALAKATGAPQ